MNGNRVTLITLGVSDLDRSKAYYTALGFNAEDGPPSVVFYRCGALYFGLYPLPDLAAEQNREAGQLGNGAMSLSQNYPDRAGVDMAYARAIDAGAKALSAPQETHWGGYSGYLADPDGHVWEYAHNPFWPLDDEGYLE